MFGKIRKPAPRRRGAMAVMVFFGLLLTIFVAALVIDVGYMVMTKTQMQAAADSATLSGGTELMPGLGRFATKTPAEVEAAARPVAVKFAAANRAGDVNAAYLNDQRDIFFGTAAFDAESGAWEPTLGATPYNMIGVVLRRDQDGSSNGDAPLTLFFGRVLGRSFQDLRVHAMAVIMPAKGFRVTDEDETSGIIPFAYRQPLWERLEEAQQWYDDHPSYVIPEEYVPGDPDYPMTDAGEPMFHSQDIDHQGNPAVDRDENPIYVQDIFDNFLHNPDTGAVSGTTRNPLPDGFLEVNIYPQDFQVITAGNAGTIDLGETNNAAVVIGEQILNGLTASDYEAMAAQGLLDEQGQLVLDPTVDPPLTLAVNGDTGISGGPIDHAFNDIIGETRVMTLFSQAVKNGNNVTYTLTRFVGLRVLYADLGARDKVVWVSMASVVEGTAVPDLDDEIGEDTTVFTPLILIQ